MAKFSCDTKTVLELIVSRKINSIDNISFNLN